MHLKNRKFVLTYRLFRCIIRAVRWLNYHHLLYFWVVAKRGTITAACEELRLAQPTISAQLRALEKDLGHKLFRRVGRNLVLTDSGRIVYRHAQEIFPVGQDLIDTLEGRPTGAAVLLRVGVTDVFPKLLAYRFLAPALNLPEPVRIVCYEGKPGVLLGQLAAHELDLVLSESPIGPEVQIRAFHHQLGECGVSIFATKSLAVTYRRRFPRSLDGAPFLLPTDNTTRRRSLDHWFTTKGLRPLIVGEFEDSALLKAFGQAGTGLFAAPTVIEKETQKQYGVRVVGRLETVREQFYAISLERKLKHSAVVSIVEQAHRGLFN